jgi:hypothetical protein
MIQLKARKARPYLTEYRKTRTEDAILIISRDQSVIEDRERKRKKVEVGF